jgi:exopolysaccharide biosynthesis polyprenyl glycosylphosphotransferase
LLEEYRLAGSHMSAVLVVGGTNSAVALAVRLRSAPAAGFRVAGLCLPGGPAAWSEQDTVSDHGFPVVGDLDDVLGALARSGADMVAIAASESFGSEEVRQLSWKLEGLGIAIALAPALTDVAGPRIHIRPVAGLPLLYVEEPRFRGPKLIAKSVLDAVGSAVLIVLFAPLLVGVAAAIKISDRGPVFFRQERVGINGKLFKVWKFRSMVVDAEARLDAVAADRRNAGNEILFKAKDDPRITSVGRFIRRFSIDEIPQLFNVFRTDMSLVGPRPQLPSEVELLGDTALRRLLVKPGMTGLWQVSGRSDLSWEDTVRLDVYYVENWSVAGDLVIMARTFRAVLGRHGAY